MLTKKEIQKIIKETPWHDKEFEPDVVKIFLNAGFKWINGGRNYELNGHQIEAHFRFEDEIYGSYEVIVECKNKVPGANLKKEFQYFRDTVARKLRKRNRLFLFISKNTVSVSTVKEQKSKKERRVGLWTKNELEYIQNLSNALPQISKYEIMDFICLSNGKEMEGKRRMGPYEYEEVPQQGRELILFHMPIKDIWRLGYVARLKDAELLEEPTRSKKRALREFQRSLKTRKLRSIGRYIDNERGTFPNSILLTFDKDDVKKKGRKLLFKCKYGVLKIIDGQHRIYGYTYSDKQPELDLVCIAIPRIDIKDEAKLFEVINTKQDKIDPNLIDYLSLIFGFAKKVDRLAIKIAIKLNEEVGGIFYDDIFRGFGSKRKLKLHNFKTSIIHSIARNRIEGKEDVDIKRMARIIGLYYTLLKEYIPPKNMYWSKFIYRDGGLSVMLHVLENIWRKETRPNKQPSKRMLEKYVKRMQERVFVTPRKKKKEEYIRENFSKRTSGESSREALAREIWETIKD